MSFVLHTHNRETGSTINRLIGYRYEFIGSHQESFQECVKMHQNDPNIFGIILHEYGWHLCYVNSYYHIYKENTSIPFECFAQEVPNKPKEPEVTITTKGL